MQHATVFLSGFEEKSERRSATCPGHLNVQSFLGISNWGVGLLEQCTCEALLLLLLARTSFIPSFILSRFVGPTMTIIVRQFDQQSELNHREKQTNKLK